MAHHDHQPYRAVDAALRLLLRHAPPRPTFEWIALKWGFRYRPAPRIVAMRSGMRMQVDPSDYLQLLLYYMGTFEEAVLRVMRRCLPAGGTMMDVGANVGVFTLDAARCVGPTGRVIAVEPAPCHIDALRTNVEHNGLANVAIVCAAAGAQGGPARLAMPAGANRGMFTLGQADAEHHAEVTVRTLTDIAAEARLDRIDVIKMDIEGSEDAALRGAAELLARHRPTLLMELNDKALASCGSDSAQIKHRLRDAGYVGARITRNRIEPLAPDAAHVCDECVFVHRDRTDLAAQLLPHVST